MGKSSGALLQANSAGGPGLDLSDLPGGPPAGFLPDMAPSAPSPGIPSVALELGAQEPSADEDQVEKMDYLQPSTELTNEGLMAGGDELGHQVASLNGNGGPGPADDPQPDRAAPTQNGTSSRVFTEYQDLLQDTPEAYTLEDNVVGPPVDINLMSSLVHWTSMARQRVGEQQLKSLLDLYIQSGHSSPALQDLVLNIVEMVDTVPSLSREGPDEWMDLMFCLHGILTGGLPVVKIPQVRLPNLGGSEVDQDN